MFRHFRDLRSDLRQVAHAYIAWPVGGGTGQSSERGRELRCTDPSNGSEAAGSCRVRVRVTDGSAIVTGLTRSLGQKSPGVNNTHSQSVPFLHLHTLSVCPSTPDTSVSAPTNVLHWTHMERQQIISLLINSTSDKKVYCIA